MYLASVLNHRRSQYSATRMTPDPAPILSPAGLYRFARLGGKGRMSRVRRSGERPQTDGRRITTLQRTSKAGPGGATVGTAMSILAGHPQIGVAALLVWVVFYFFYKVAWRRDFGLPVRRRVATRGLMVERNQVAYVPFWWSDLQVQRALDRYWKRTLRKGFDRQTLQH